jgi:predicted Rossmann fold nucleotide-binding protein DprA/Smf involved in DNA uptake
MGAVPVTSANDVLQALNIVIGDKRNHELLAENQVELDIITTLQDGVSDAEDILARTKLSVSQLNSHLTILEIRGIVSPLGGNHWTLR